MTNPTESTPDPEIQALLNATQPELPGMPTVDEAIGNLQRALTALDQRIEANTTLRSQLQAQIARDRGEKAAIERLLKASQPRRRSTK